MPRSDTAGTFDNPSSELQGEREIQLALRYEF
jgi:hypothetical protein